MAKKTFHGLSTVAQKGHVHYQFQYLQLPILSFLITNFQLVYFSLPISNFLIFDFQYVASYISLY